MCAYEFHGQSERFLGWLAAPHFIHYPFSLENKMYTLFWPHEDKVIRAWSSHNNFKRKKERRTFLWLHSSHHIFHKGSCAHKNSLIRKWILCAYHKLIIFLKGADEKKKWSHYYYHRSHKMKRATTSHVNCIFFSLTQKRNEVMMRNKTYTADSLNLTSWL